MKLFFFLSNSGLSRLSVAVRSKGFLETYRVDVMCRGQLQLKRFQCIGTMLRYDVKEELLSRTPCKHSNNGQKGILLSRKLCGAEDY